MTRPHPHLLELAAWPWLDRLSRKAGQLIRLEDVPGREWDTIATQGFDYVYLMGVWERSLLGRWLARVDADLRREYDRVLPDWSDEDIPGSPYCISAYVPDGRMGGWTGLDGARAALHARGVQLVVDFVPNHTGFDHPWVLTHPERYVLGDEDDLSTAPDDFRRVGRAVVACGRDPYFPPWRDVAQLNYFNPDTRSAMIGVLREIAAHADAVRCDMAMLALNDVFDRTWRPVLRNRWAPATAEFWPDAISAAPSLTYVAEVYWDLEWTLQQQGFHFTYDKRLLDRLHGGSAREIRGHLLADSPFRDRLTRFLENHDEPRSAVSLRHRLGAAATMLVTLPGMRFFFDGQLDGARIKPPVQLGKWPDEPVVPLVREMYERLLAATWDSLFHEGDWQLIEVGDGGDSTDADLIAWEWRLEGRLAVVVVNLGAGMAQG
nr:alpha-amylase [Acidobacteriota bacterium]